jgi:hypothetical protein
MSAPASRNSRRSRRDLVIPVEQKIAKLFEKCLVEEARFGITGPDNDNKQVKQVIDLKPGQLIFIPQG